MAKAPLLFIHGMWSRPQVWARFRDHFEALGHDCHTPALPWHDVAPQDPVPSRLAATTVSDYVNALEEASRQCSETPVIVGHSLGGLLGQLLAVRVQPRGLVLLSTAPSSSVFALGIEPLRTLWPIARQWGYWTRATLLPPTAAMYGIFNNVPQDEAEQEVQALVHDSGRVLFQLSMPWFDREHGGFVEYARLAMPTLMMCGTQDRITPLDVSRATARRLAGPVTFREMEGFGHWIIGRQGGPAVIAQIESFLAGL